MISSRHGVVRLRQAIRERERERERETWPMWRLIEK